MIRFHKKQWSSSLTLSKPLTFRWRAVLFLFPMIVVISSVYTLESIYTERRILRNEIIKKGEAIVSIAAKNAELPLLSENIEQLKDSARPLMETKDVSFVSFVNSHSRELLYEGKKYYLTTKNEKTSNKTPALFEHHDVFEFVAPVYSLKVSDGFFLLERPEVPHSTQELVGWVHIGFSKEIMGRSEHQIIVRCSVLAILFSIVGGILLYVLTNLATRPLYALITAVKDVQNGDNLGKEVKVDVSLPISEIGLLSSEFNRMSHAIREREDSLQKNIGELETIKNQLQINVQELEMQVSAREAVEEELIKHRDNLENLVSDRTSQLTAAKDLAEAANRAKSDFLSSMSHELRTPLNSILGYTQILALQKNITGSQRQQLDVMRESGMHLLMLINDILDVSKIEARKMEVEVDTFDLSVLLAQVYDITKLHAEDKNLLFHCHISPDVPQYVLGDERKIRQIFLNLLSNAVKYTQKGHITFYLDYHGGDLRCDVVDTGIGISADKLESVFEPFTQLVNHRQVREGTGLGLSITRQLLSLMGGKIEVESTPDQGSAFKIKLPLPHADRIGISPRENIQEVVGYTGSRKKVMIVDDNINNVAMLVSLLDPLDFAITTAGNGREALHLALENCPDLIIMDLVMPEMDGLETVNEIRRHQNLISTKIIGASATATDSDCKDIFVSSCDDFLTKPIQIESLLESIKKTLGIEWETQASDVVQTSKESSHNPESQVVPPPQKEIEELYLLAMRGNMQKISEWATNLENNNSVYSPFSNKLRELTAEFKVNAIIEFASLLREKQPN